MNATLTELRRQTTEVLRPVIAGRGKLIIIDRGAPCLEISPLRQVERKAALAALRAIGPVELPPGRLSKTRPGVWRLVS